MPKLKIHRVDGQMTEIWREAWLTTPVRTAPNNNENNILEWLADTFWYSSSNMTSSEAGRCQLLIVLLSTINTSSQG